jgi:hypothetical protein
LTQTIKGKRMNLMLGTYIYIDCMATKILAWHYLNGLNVIISTQGMEIHFGKIS